jgi:hypothetical protein
MSAQLRLESILVTVIAPLRIRSLKWCHFKLMRSVCTFVLSLLANTIQEALSS